MNAKTFTREGVGALVCRENQKNATGGSRGVLLLTPEFAGAGPIIRSLAILRRPPSAAKKQWKELRAAAPRRRERRRGTAFWVGIGDPLYILGAKEVSILKKSGNYPQKIRIEGSLATKHGPQNQPSLYIRGRESRLYEKNLTNHLKTAAKKRSLPQAWHGAARRAKTAIRAKKIPPEMGGG